MNLNLMLKKTIKKGDKMSDFIKALHEMALSNEEIEDILKIMFEFEISI